MREAISTKSHAKHHIAIPVLASSAFTIKPVEDFGANLLLLQQPRGTKVKLYFSYQISKRNKFSVQVLAK